MTTTVLAYIPSPAQGVWHITIPFLDISLPIRAYAMCIIAGIIVALVISDRRWQQRGGEAGVIYDIALWAVPFGLIGGRLYHVITDWPTYFGADGAGFIAALRIWDGGLGIWGAVALGGVGAWIACRRRGIPLPAFGDTVAPGIVLAQAIGRLGNYFNQELYGRETTMPWGLEIFNRRDPSGLISVHSLDGVSVGPPALMVVHPTFLYELLWNVLVFVILILVDRRFTIGHGRLFALYVAAYCVGRFGVELLRSDPATLIAGIRINSFTATLVFIGAVVYMMAAPKGREDPDKLLGRPSDRSDAEGALAKEMVAVGATSGVVVAATVAGREDDVDDSTPSSSDAKPSDVQPDDIQPDDIQPDDIQPEDFHDDLVADIIGGGEVQGTDVVDERAIEAEPADAELASADEDLVVADIADGEPAPAEDEVVANVEDTAAVADDSGEDHVAVELETPDVEETAGEAFGDAVVEPAPATEDVVVADVAGVEPASADDVIVANVEDTSAVADEASVSAEADGEPVAAEDVVANVEDTAAVADDSDEDHVAVESGTPEIADEGSAEADVEAAPASDDVVVADVADVEPGSADDVIVVNVEDTAAVADEAPAIAEADGEPVPADEDVVANVEDTEAVADDSDEDHAAVELETPDVEETTGEAFGDAVVEPTPTSDDVVVADVADVEPASADDVIVANVEDTSAVADEAPVSAEADGEPVPVEDEVVANVEDTAAVPDDSDDHPAAESETPGVQETAGEASAEADVEPASANAEIVANVEDTSAVADDADDDVVTETPGEATAGEKPSPYSVIVTPTEPTPGRLRRLFGRRGR